jgi:D-tyrosyl-tRNA(Tyr) deacylase
MELAEEAPDTPARGCAVAWKMRALVQRVREASVTVEGLRVGGIGPGLLVFLGIRKGDSREAAGALARKVAGLRIFADEEGRMSRSLAEVGGAVLVVSQMTLYGDVSKGRRPSFDAVAPGAEAEPLYEAFVADLRGAGIGVETGRFGAMMDVSLVNDGPVTFMLEVDS